MIGRSPTRVHLAPLMYVIPTNGCPQSPQALNFEHREPLTRDAGNRTLRRQTCGPLWSGELRRLHPSTSIWAGLIPAQIGSRCDAPSSPVALVTRAATPVSTPRPGGFIARPRGDLFLHCNLEIEFSRGHCGQSGNTARKDREKRCDRMIVGPSSDESGSLALSVLTQGECLVSLQRREFNVVAIQPMR